MIWNDQAVEQRMGRLLQAGVVLAAAVMGVGGFIYLFVTPGPAPDYKHFHAATESFRSIPKIFVEAFHGNAAALIQIGTLLMIATPVARVAFSVYAFAEGRDRLYVVISSIVLALLIYGIFFGR